MQIRPLEPGDFPLLLTTFNEAFSDYAVAFQLSADALAEMLLRRGYAPQASVGVFDGDRLVAFTLNGLGGWRGRLTGYDTGTGVVPSNRGRGLSSRMIDAATDLLRAAGARQYLLEVLQSNERAIRVYQRAGFEVTRALQCWSVDSSEASPPLPPAAAIDWTEVARWFDVDPSWQNSIEAVGRARAPRTIYAATGGRLLGCAVVFDNGDLPFLAVAPDARRNGFGRQLLRSASAGRALRVLNVDASSAAADSFLRACGATPTVAQWEMVRPL
jgi:ribosomal protein S18 acetylase RimI-like enzyme